jgi:hypothetical protein
MLSAGLSFDQVYDMGWIFGFAVGFMAWPVVWCAMVMLAWGIDWVRS